MRRGRERVWGESIRIFPPVPILTGARLRGRVGIQYRRRFPRFRWWPRHIPLLSPGVWCSFWFRPWCGGRSVRFCPDNRPVVLCWWRFDRCDRSWCCLPGRWGSLWIFHNGQDPGRFLLRRLSRSILHVRKDSMCPDRCWCRDPVFGWPLYILWIATVLPKRKQ